MRRILIASAIFAGISASATAAVPGANIKVAGDVKPPTCKVNGGAQADLVYNLGGVSPALIPEDNAGYNGLPSVSNALNVVCDAATYLTFKATDTYSNAFVQAPGSADQLKNYVFSLVDASATGKAVGGVTYQFNNITADSRPVYISRANDGDYPDDGSSWFPEWRIMKGATSGWTKTQQRNVARDNLDLIQAKIFTINIYVYNFGIINGYADTYLLPKSVLKKQGIDLTKPVNFTGNVLMTFNFGI